MRGHIRPRGRGVWQVEVDAGTDPVTGKRRKTYRTVRGPKREAEAVLARLLVERGAGGVAADPTVGELVQHYLDTSRMAATTRAEAERAKGRVPDWLARTPAWKVRGPDLTRAYLALEGGGLSVHQVRQVHVFLSAAFGAAVKWGVLAANPAAAANPPTVVRRPIVPPDPGEVARLLDAADGDLFVALALAATTGMRRGEVCGLQWGDVNLLGALVTVRRSVAYTPAAGLVVKTTKTGRERTVALGPAVVGILSDWYATCAAAQGGEAPSGYVLSLAFDGVEPWRPDLFTHRFVRLRDKVGLPTVRLHDLRHYVATQLLVQGTDVRTVAGRLGHSRASTTTDRYAGFVPAADRAAAELLDVKPRITRSVP